MGLLSVILLSLGPVVGANDLVFGWPGVSVYLKLFVAECCAMIGDE